MQLATFKAAATSGTSVYADVAYAPFGELYAASGNSDPSFTGQNQDMMTGLYDFQFRELHGAAQGRWISPDPAGLAAVNPMNPQTWNRYGYVGGSPLALTDPSGLVVAVGGVYGGVNMNYDSERGSGYNTTGGGGGDCQNPGCAGSLSARQDMGKYGKMQPGVIYGDPNGIKGNLVGGCPLSSCHTLDGTFPNLPVSNLGGLTAMLMGLTVGPSDVGVAIEEQELQGLNIVFTNHGLAHLNEYGLSYLEPEVQSAITQDIRSMNGIQGEFFGDVTVQGYTFVYRAYPLGNGTISVGTYYLPNP